MKGYQYLENDFFSLCQTRKIYRLSMLLYIYLRGLYCRFQKPVFFCNDKLIEKELGLSHKTLQRVRLTLQEKGVIKFIPGKGSKSTTYQMLGSILLPEGMVKKTTRCGHSKRRRMDNMATPLYTSYERVKKRIGIFKGTKKEERKALKAKGLL